MRAVLVNILGAWLAFGSIALFVRNFTPKDTTITCAYCGIAVPMAIATKGGIGGVNKTMQEHQRSCRDHPVYQLRQDMERIYEWCGAITRIHPDQALEVRRIVDKISDIAARA